MVAEEHAGWRCSWINCGKKSRVRGRARLHDLNPDGLLRADRHGREPIVTVRCFTAHDPVKLFLQRLDDRSNPTFIHADLIDRADGCDLGGGAAEADSVSNV